MTNELAFVARLKDEVTGSINRMVGGFDRLGKNKWVGLFTQGLGLGAGVSAWGLLQRGVSEAIGVFSGMVDKASDLREAIALGDQVFGENAETIKKWASGAADAFGMTKTEAINLAGQFGNAFKNVGASLNETTEKSQKLTRLAADLGSAFNQSSAEAAIALRSGLLGESEPMRRFGVFINDAAVQTKLLEMGEKKLGKEWTASQKVLARYQLIMEQTAETQGMFGRDQGSLADASKRLEAQLSDLQAEVGQELLPVMVEVTKWTSDELVPALRELIQVVKDNEWAFDVLGALLDSLGSGPVEALNKKLEETAQREREAATTTYDYARSNAMLSDSFKITTASAADVRAGLGDVNRDLGLMAGRTDDTADSVANLGDETEDTRDKVVTSLEDMVEAARKTRDDFTTIGKDAASALYDPLIAAGELAAVNREITEQRQIIASKESTKEQVADAKLRLLELEKTKMELEYKVRSFSGLTRDELRTSIAELQSKWQTASQETRREIDLTIRRLSALTNAALAASGALKAGSGIGTGTGGRAEGGPVYPGNTYLVGEEGPELIRLGSVGRVYNASDTRRMLSDGGGGSPAVIQLQLDGKVVAEVVDRHLYYRRQVSPGDPLAVR